VDPSSNGGGDAEFAVRLSCSVRIKLKEIDSGTLQRVKRRNLSATARCRELNAVLVWRLARSGHSLAGLILTLQKLAALEIGYASLSESFDMSKPTGRTVAGMRTCFQDIKASGTVPLAFFGRRRSCEWP